LDKDIVLDQKATKKAIKLLTNNHQKLHVILLLIINLY